MRKTVVVTGGTRGIRTGISGVLFHSGFHVIAATVSQAEIDGFIGPDGIDLRLLDVTGINVPQRRVMDVFSGLTPAMIAEVMSHLNVVEMMMAMQKMRQRKKPANQAHVTNWKENPALLATDTAEAGLRGFAEVETAPA